MRPRTPTRSRTASTPRRAAGPGLPGAARVILVLAVVALVGIVAVSATGGIGRLVSSVGGTLGGVLGDRATPTPKATPVLAIDVPLIDAPLEPYTNQPAVDLTVTIPEGTGSTARRTLRLYQARPDQPRTPLLDVPVGSNPRIVIPGVQLAAGRNDFTATIVGGAGRESDSSPPATFFLDVEPPVVTLEAPADGATINRESVTIRARTQPRAAIALVNATTKERQVATAEADGGFTLDVPLALGPNALTISAVDPAGNAGELAVQLVRGEGKLTAGLEADPSTVAASGLPAELAMNVLVRDPDGRPLEGAAVTFTLSVPGVQVVTSDATTGADGRAAFRTTVPPGATPGDGLAAVLVRTADFGETSDRVVIEVRE